MIMGVRTGDRSTWWHVATTGPNDPIADSGDAIEDPGDAIEDPGDAIADPATQPLAPPTRPSPRQA